jgi:hypothetical protein
MKIKMMAKKAALSQHESFYGFERVLQASGRIDREPGADQNKENRKGKKHQQFHREGIRDGCLRMVGFEVEHPQKCRDRAGEEVVQDFRKPELFHKELLAISPRVS